MMKTIKLRRHKMGLTSRLTQLLHYLAVVMLFFYATAATAKDKVIQVSGTSLVVRTLINYESKVTILNVADKMIYTTIAPGEHSDINPNTLLAAGIHLVKMEQAGKSVTQKIIVNEPNKPFKL